MSIRTKFDAMSDTGMKPVCTKQGRSLTKSHITNSDASQLEKELAQKALTDFNKGNHQQALNSLNKLENSRSKDIKVRHNRAVCDFYKSALTTTENFRKSLTDIIAQNSNSKGHGRLPEWPGCMESSVAVLNLAIVCYHQHHFLPAIDLLLPLYTALESLEESVGIAVCLLLVRCYLHCSRADNALSVVCHTEATFLPQPLPHASPPHTPTPAPQIRDRNNVGGSSLPGSTCGRVGMSDVSMPSCSSGSTGAKGGSTGQEALRRRLQLLRVRALTALRILKPADREFKTALLQAANAGHELELSQICIKSQLKFLRGQYLKALKVLNNCSAILPTMAIARTTPSQIRGEWPSLDVWYYNNLALIHVGLHKPVLALVYLEKAADKHRQDVAQKKRASLYDDSSTVSAALSYNLGCILLRLNTSAAMTKKAFDLFTETLQTYSSNPRLWLHLAHCCIAVHRWGLLDVAEHITDTSMVQSLGSGSSAKLLLTPHASLRMGQLCEQSSSDAAFPEPRLQFGRLCLRNALKLLPAAVADADDGEGDGGPPDVYACRPSLPVRADEAGRLRRATLCCAAYTCLSLTIPGEALHYATQLMDELDAPHHKNNHQQQQTQASYRFLANVYASHSCVMLNQYSRAVQYLDLEQIADKGAQDTNVNVSAHFDHLPFTSGHIPLVHKDQLGLLQFNLCVIYAMREEYDQATALLKTIWSGQTESKPTTLVMLTIYIHLKKGELEQAREVIHAHILQ